jgi:uncharacterized membrane protein
MANEHWQPLPKSFKFLLVVVLAIGIFFRFANLEQKIYWGDEGYTSLWISGHTSTELMSSLFTGQIIQVEDFQKYQGIFPGKNVIDTVNALAKDSPFMPPLYFALVRCWVEVFGDSIAAIRSFSAFASLFVFPAIYWLCLELFNSSLVGWIAIAFTAVCPYQVLYAQEARPYILWAVTILLSSACLLRAIRINKPLNWVIYAIALTAGLYTHIFSVFVTFGQGIYLLIIERFRLNKILMNYLLSSLAAVLLFFPWFLCIIKFQKYYPDSSGSSIVTLVKRLIGLFTRCFIDLGSSYLDSAITTTIMTIISIVFIIIIGCSFWFLIFHNSVKIWSFVLLSSLPILPIAFLRDLIKVSQVLLTSPRYLFSVILFVQISVAYLVYFLLQNRQKNKKKYQIFFLSLISSGILSCAVSLPAETWWNKPIPIQYDPIVEKINQSQNPVIISDINLWAIYNLIYYPNLDTSNLQFKLFTPETLEMFDFEQDMSMKSRLTASNPANDDRDKKLFLFWPSQQLITKVRNTQNWDLESMPGVKWLWKVTSLNQKNNIS